MLIIVTGIRPVTSLFLIILTTKTRRAPESGCQLTAIACSVVGRPRGTLMQIVIGNVLSDEEIKLVRGALKRARFIDGRATAGFAARLVKNKLQAGGGLRSLGTSRQRVAQRLLRYAGFRLARRAHTLAL